VTSTNWHEKNFMLRDARSTQNLVCIDDAYTKTPLMIGSVRFTGELKVICVPLVRMGTHTLRRLCAAAPTDLRQAAARRHQPLRQARRL
jgi:hypothetical protein